MATINKTIDEINQSIDFADELRQLKTPIEISDFIDSGGGSGGSEGYVTPQMFGATGVSNKEADAYQDAINFAAANNLDVRVYNLHSTFYKSVEFKPGVRLIAENSSITVDGDFLKIPFTTQEHCETDHLAFVEDLHISGMKFICMAELPAAGVFVNYVAWRAVNVRKWSMTNCTFENIGGGYVAHAIRFFGDYDDNVTNNPSPAADPAVFSGLTTTGGDLNEDLLFAYNSCYIPVRESDGLKTLVQAFRHEFCERVWIIDNTSVRGGISGWGGSPNIPNGGELVHLRRCRDVIARGNDLTEVNALYWINGYNVKASENTVRRAIDVGIDFEGCVYCQAFNNFVYTSGNGSLSTFYHSKNIMFTDNICYEDGSAKNINDEFGYGTRWDPSNSDTFYLNTGSHSPVEGEDEVILKDNTFIWGGETGSGLIDVRDATFIDFSNNTLINVCFSSQWNNQGRVSVTGNKFNFTQDARREKLVALGDNESAKYAPEFKDNYMYLSANQSLPCYATHFFQGDNDNFFTEVTGNRFLHEGSSRKTTADIALLNTSINGGRCHTYHIDNNVFGGDSSLVDLSSRDLAHVLSLGEGNISFRDSPLFEHTEEASGSKAFFIDNVPTGFGFMTGQKLENRDKSLSSHLGIVATVNGWDLPSSKQWTPNTAYARFDAVYVTSGYVYFCTGAGTSSTVEPTDTTFSDGSATWARVGKLIEWKEYASLGQAIQRS